MDIQVADELSQVFDRLESAEQNFKYNLENQIMNGYPIRIMDECKKKLLEAQGLGLPDATKYPKLHGYLAKLQTERLERDEAIKKHEEFMQSKEGLKIKAMAEISKLQCEIQCCNREQFNCENEARKYDEKAKEAKNKAESLYQKLTGAHIALTQLGE